MSRGAALDPTTGLLEPGVRPEIPGAPQAIADVLARVVQADPGREALVGRRGRYSYAELDREADRAANALAGLGVIPGVRVAASLPNDTEIVVAFLATQRLGAVWVGINRALAPPEKTYMLADCQAAVFIGDETQAAQIGARRGELPALRHVVRADPVGASADGPGRGELSWRGLLERASDRRAPASPVDPFAPAAIAYTGGTTGFPKGAVHSQHNLLVSGAVARAEAWWTPEERLGVLLPLTILNLMVLVPLTAFQIGSTCVAMDRIDPLGIAAWVRDERIATFHAVPAILHDLLTHPDVKPQDLAPLARPEVGGADCPDAFRRLYRERFGRDISIGYGMTEAPTAVTRALPGSPNLPGICGKPLPWIEIRILDEKGAERGPGEIGEICVAAARSGPFAGVYTPMLGYWRKPQETAEALRDGVYRTGDLGMLDAGGTLFIRGRKKELILRGGANVYPAEVERVLHSDPRVRACAVVGKPDPRLGERVVAFVELAPGAEASPQELQARCAGALARYKVPEEFRFVTTMPRTPMGKIRKPELRALLEGNPED
jgi:acyl-CoA synthetase (AMP-forming)/AMP-acid ligase II